MDSKRVNDITLLNNQIIILDAWNTWKQKTEETYANRINDAQEKANAQAEETARIKRAVNMLDYGRSLGVLIMIIVCAALYIAPYFIDLIKPYAPYCAVGTSLLLIPYIFWCRGTRKSILAHLLFWLTNGIPYMALMYFLSRKDGQPNLYYALFENPKFEQINRYYWYLTIGSIVILAISMIIRKIHYVNVKNKLNKAQFEAEADESEANDRIKELEIERDQLLLNKEKEYFSKYPLVLPNYSIADVKKLLQYMINHRADSIKEAINLSTNDDALQSIQNDVKALRVMQEKTNEEIENMKKVQEEPQEEEEEKEDLVY